MFDKNKRLQMVKEELERARAAFKNPMYGKGLHEYWGKEIYLLEREVARLSENN